MTRMGRVYALSVDGFTRSVLVLLLAGAAAAQDASPPVHYLGRRVARTMSYHGANWLVRKEREREERTSELLKALEIKPGQVVCDLGCGNGYHSLPLAEMVGEAGKVLCVDIQPEMLALLKRRAKQQGLLERIRPILCTATDPKLEPGSVDLLLMVDVYHEISHPESVLAHVRNALKPGGRVVFVEFRTEDLSVPIKHEHKMSKKQVVREARANGLKLVRSFAELPWQHVLFFERAELPVDSAGTGSWARTEGAPKISGVTVSSTARMEHGRVDGAVDVIFGGVAPAKKRPGPLTLSVTLTGSRVAGHPLRFLARPRSRPRDEAMWVSSPLVGATARLVHAGTDRRAADRSLVTWTMPFVRTGTTGSGVVLMFERTTSSEEIRVVQQRDRLTVVGVQRTWTPGQSCAFRFGIVTVEGATDTAATELYEAWSHEAVR
jgi:ubiquinone/menaquinone biosynthesis C-methylase UbiE